jgi:hypothetical protein
MATGAAVLDGGGRRGGTRQKVARRYSMAMDVAVLDDGNGHGGTQQRPRTDAQQ